RARLELLLAGPLRRLARRRERALGRGELGERSLQRGGGAAPERLRFSHLLREGFELGAALERPPPRRRRGSREKHGAVGPSQGASCSLAALQNFVAGKQRAYPCGRRAVDA